MTVLSLVPEMPQEVAFSEQVVTSVFLTWRPPTGQVEGYKVRLKGWYTSVPSRQLWIMMCILTNCLKHILLKIMFLRANDPLTTSGTVLTHCLLNNGCSDSITDSLKMYDLCGVSARKNDQAYYKEAQYKPTFSELKQNDIVGCVGRVKIKKSHVSCISYWEWVL